MDTNLFAILTESSCGLACWHAQEDVCRCSCGGKNHGIMAHGGKQPERQCKIAGKWHKLAAVGAEGDIRRQAFEYNWFGNYAAGKLRRFSAIDKGAIDSQLRWSECAAWIQANGGKRPSLLWLPVVSIEQAEQAI